MQDAGRKSNCFQICDSANWGNYVYYVYMYLGNVWNRGTEYVVVPGVGVSAGFTFASITIANAATMTRQYRHKRTQQYRLKDTTKPPRRGP